MFSTAAAASSTGAAVTKVAERVAKAVRVEIFMVMELLKLILPRVWFGLIFVKMGEIVIGKRFGGWI